MKRIRSAGLCVVAIFALGAVAASSAYAGEYGECLKAPKVKEGKKAHSTGRWNDGGCEASQNLMNEGEYEWHPGTPKDFEITSTTTKANLTSEFGRVECKKGADEGKILGAQYNVETTLFKECSLFLEESKTAVGKCTGLPAGEILLLEGELLAFSDTYLIDHGTKGSSGLEPKEREVWNAYFASEGEPYFPYMAIFECHGVIFRVGGQASGVVTPVSKMTPKWKVAFGAGKGEQDLETEYSTNGGLTYIPIPSTLTVVVNNSTRDKSKIEIRDCNEKGAVSEGKGAFPCEREEPLPW